MSRRLDSYRAKLEWAEKQFGDLGLASNAYHASRPYELLADEDLATGQRVLYHTLHRRPPLVLGLIIGDLAHNLRSALDHLAYQLVLTGTSNPNKQTAFPIYDTRAGYTNAIATKLPGISPAVEAAVQSVQPYHRGKRAKSHPLWMLQDLNITDKHKTLQLTAVGIVRKSLGIQTAEGCAIFDLTVFHARVMKKRTEFVRYRVTPPWAGKLQVQMKPDVSLSIHFGKGCKAIERRDVYGVVQAMRDYIRDEVTPRFTPFFP